jgi:hypothetical protein
VRIRTEPALLPPVGLMLPAVPPPPAVPKDLPPVRSAMAMVDGAEGSAEATLDDEEPVPRGRLVGIVIICLLLGVLGASVVLYQLGLVGGTTRPGSIEDVLAKADDALQHSRWESPSGDNVRDITNDGLARWPRDRRLLDVRARATDELVKEAVGRKFAGDLAAALHLAHLANELDPDDTTAQHLVEEYEQIDKKPATEPSASHGLVATTPLPSVTHPPATHPTPSAVPVAGGVAPRVSLEPSLAKPRVGQSVTFTAKVAGATGPARTIEDPRFTINGPGLASDTRLGTLGGAPGTYSATFTGFEPGKHEVEFDAKVDGALVRVTRAIVFEGEPAVVPPPPGASSGKWL